MPSLWFVVPARGRLELARICLTQLRRTCDLLEAEGVRATAVVIADDENLDTARELGFGTVERNNQYLARKFNDGIQLALDPAHNPYPADYVVPCGSDDWVDHRLFLDLPAADRVVGFQHLAIVREDGREISCRRLDYMGGAGIRIYPAELMRPFGYRPADPDRKRACDTSILTNLALHHGIGNLLIEHRPPIHDFQIVDWKSPTEQLNTYADLAAVYRPTTTADPFEVLADFYPPAALEDMRALYASRELVAV
jgi:hypothetical protein